MAEFISTPGGAACTPNIGPKGIRQRAIAGAVFLAVGVAVLAALVFTGANPLWRLALFLFFGGGGVTFFQATEKT